MPKTFSRSAYPTMLLGALLLAASVAPPAVLAQAPLPPAAPIAAASPPPRADIALLQKALSPLVNSPAADSESEMDISASKKGSLFNLHEHLKVTARRPARFASSVTLTALPGGKPTRFLVASDGVKVTTFRPDVNKYAVVPLSDFQAGDDAFPALGLVVGLLYLGDTAFVKNLDMLAKDDTGQSQAALRKMGMALTSKAMTAGGTAYTVFTLRIGKQGAYRFYVNPGTGQMAQIELRTVQDGVMIRMTEKLVSFNPLLSAPTKTFLMAPPLEAQRVPKLPVGYF